MSIQAYSALNCTPFLTLESFFTLVRFRLMNLFGTTSSKALAHISVVAVSVVSVTTAPRGA
jgi:hypothetical protein